VRYLSLFSGIEAASVAWEPLGWEPVAFCEVDEFASAVLAHRYPDVPNLGDITKVDWKKFKEEHGTPDVLVGGSPCFVAGTLVLTDKKLVPIEDIRVGDMVLTHKGRFKRVLRVGHTDNARTVLIKGQGSVGIECTPNHPFWSTSLERAWNNDERKYDTYFSKPKFVAAENMKGRKWLNVTKVPAMEVPGFNECPEKPMKLDGFDVNNPDFFYLVGRWLGDGCLYPNPSNKELMDKDSHRTVVISCGKNKFDKLNEAFGKVERLNPTINEIPATFQFAVQSKQLHKWLADNFGFMSHGKHLPTWALGMPQELRKSLFDGYVDSDGCMYRGKIQTTSVSKELTIGMKVLAGTLGLTSNVVLSNREGSCVIEGRTVKQRDTYLQRYGEPNRLTSFNESGVGFWGKVRHVDPCRESVTVYNLEVEDDHSYTVDAVGCSNCQSFSIAGGRASLDGQSRLMYEYIRACREVQSTFVLWENVPGSLNTKDNAFAQLIDSLQDCGYCDLSWRVLDAQFFGVAQRRRRVFLVGHLAAGGGCSAAVLFDAHSCEGNPPSSKDKRKALAAAAGRGAGGAGGEGCLNGWDVQSKRIFSPDGIAPTLSSGTTEGMNIQPCVMQSAGFKYHQGARAGNIGYESEQSPTITADWHSPGVITFSQNTRNEARPQDDMFERPVAFAQNQRDEVRIINGDGDLAGCQSAQRFGTYKNETLLCVASGQANAEHGEGFCPTLSARQFKDPPIVIDRAAFNQGVAAKFPPHVEQTELMDTLVARGPHAVAYKQSLPTDAT